MDLYYTKKDNAMQISVHFQGIRRCIAHPWAQQKEQADALTDVPTNVASKKTKKKHSLTELLGRV